MDKDRVARRLAGCTTLPKEINSELEMLNILNKGLPIEALAEIEHRGIIDEFEMKSFIAARTLARRKSEKRLSPEESDLVARIVRIYDFAAEVFGDEQKAHKWLRTSNRALSGQQPLALLRTDYGARMVESILGRIAHGIYS